MSGAILAAGGRLRALSAAGAVHWASVHRRQARCVGCERVRASLATDVRASLAAAVGAWLSATAAGGKRERAQGSRRHTRAGCAGARSD